MIKSGGGYIILGKEDIAKLQSLRKNGITQKGNVRIHKLDFTAIETVMQDAQDREPDEIARIREMYAQFETGEKYRTDNASGKIRRNLAEISD